MNKVEIIGRLKNHINIDMKNYQCNDVNDEIESIIERQYNVLKLLIY